MEFRTMCERKLSRLEIIQQINLRQNNKRTNKQREEGRRISLSLRGVSHTLSAKQKLVFMLLAAVLCAMPLWLGLQRVHSAPSELAGSRAPLPQQPTIYALTVPAQVLIGDTFKFQVKFKNLSGTFGFGPFVDLVLDAGGANISQSPGSCSCDGITFVSAEMVGVNGGPLAITPTAPSPITSPCVNAPNIVTHPFGPFAVSGIQPVTVPAGAQFVTLELPFGSFDPTQPDIVIEVTAKVSNLADYNFPLKISARSGFRYGTDALNNPTTDHPILSDENPPGTQVTDSTLWQAQAQTKPTVMIIKKEYNGLEDETATGPNYPHHYSITVNIADGQSIAGLVVQDILPNNMQYQGLVGVWIHGNSATGGTACGIGVDYVLSQPLLTVPGGTLAVSFCAPIIGAPSPPDVKITFSFFIPKVDASEQLVLQPNCVPALSKNNIMAEGDWSPQDTCDQTPVHVLSDVSPVDHTLSDKCIAIQKSVAIATDLNTLGLTPDDTLRYVLSFQLTDYKTFGSLRVVDFLSDGQKIVLTGPLAPTLTVTDQFGTTSGTFVLNSDLFSASAPPDPSCAGPAVLTQLIFQVSAKMNHVSPPNSRHAAGILTGGYATTSSSPIPATGRIVFYAKVLDQFSGSYSTGNRNVDKHDPMINCVNTMDAKVFTNVDPPAMPGQTTVIAHDDSKTATAIVGDTLAKSVYAVKRKNNSGIYVFVCGPGGQACFNYPNPPQEVRPGDRVTFRLTKTIPSGDSEKLTVEDWLPQPIFNVIGTGFTNTVCGVPSPGSACLGPTDQLHLSPIFASPTFTVNTPTNSIKFDYPNFHYTLNTKRTIDLLFTHTVTYEPFADNLFLTNEAQECEYNTFGDRFCQTAIAQVNLREPNLRIRKGVIATDNPNGLFSQLGPPPTATLATAHAPANATFNLLGFSGVIDSTSLAGWVNSDLTNVDANDKVTFAVVIENLGGHPAYDAKLEDILPSCFTNLSVISVKRGTGAPVLPFLYSLVPSATGFTITSISSPLSFIPQFHATNGSNIVVITFQAQLLSNITPGCCRNEAKLLHYASQPGGPNFVQAGFGGPFYDYAEVCVLPKADKCVTATSEVHTQADNSVSGTPQPPQVTIGEIIRYHLTVTLPEGVSPIFRVTDHLPSGLTYMPGTAKVAFVSTLGITSTATGLSGAGMPDPVNYTLGCLKPNPTVGIPSNLVTPGSFTPGVAPTFNLGTLINNDNDSNLEYVIIEFNALVNNVSTNVDTATLRNYYEIFVGQTQVAIATSNDSYVVIVEPKFTMTKTVAPNPAIKGQTLTYTVQYTNNGTADAFDVELKDTLPPGLTLGAVTAGCPYVTGSNVITMTCAHVPKAPDLGSTVILTYQALANPEDCPVTLANQANLAWTSLPGDKGTLASTLLNPTTNLTGSSTPGSSGEADGERNGVTLPLTLNDYVKTASAAVEIDCPCCATPPPHMVSWWPLNETTGNIVVDIIGGHNGTTSANIGSDPQSVIPSSTIPSKVGNALHFSNSKATVAGSPYNFGTGSFSIDAWVRGYPGNAALGIIDKLDTSTTTPTGFAFFVRSGKVQLVMGNGTSTPATFMSTPTFTYGIWQHVAVTVQRDTSGSIGRFYLNGNPAGTFVPPPTSVDNANSLLLGNYHLNPVGCSSCRVMLDEIEIFNDVMSPSDILAIFNADSDGKCPPVSLTVTKTITVTPSPPPWTPPATAVFPVTVNCQPSGYNQTLNLTPVLLTQTFNNIPIGNTCTVTEGPLPAPYGHPACFALGWSLPVYSPAQTVTISGSSQTVSINNTFGCLPCVTPPPGMVAWWPLDELNGTTTVMDIVGFNNQGTPKLGSPLGSPNSPTPVPGKVRGALFLGDPNSGIPYVEVLPQSELDLSSGDFSIDAWVRIREVPGFTGIYPIVQKFRMPSGPGFAFYVKNKKLELKVNGNTFISNSGPQISFADPEANTGPWYHVAVTVRRSPQEVKFYINGILAGTFAGVPTASVNNGEPLWIGKTLLAGGHQSPIAVDELELFKRVLTQTEIQKIIDADTAGKCWP